LTDPIADASFKQELRFLRQRLNWLCWTWQDYKILFINDGNLELLGGTIGSLAALIQNSLLDSIELDISALSESDHNHNGKNTNLSMHRLVHWLKRLECDPTTIEEICRKLDEAQGESGRMKKRRNKLIAHYDLHTIATEAPDLLKWPTEEEISTVITLLIEAMNTAERALGECRYDYDFSGDSFRKGAEVLIDILNNCSLAQATEPEGL